MDSSYTTYSTEDSSLLYSYAKSVLNYVSRTFLQEKWVAFYLIMWPTLYQIMYFKNRYSVVMLQTGKIKCLNKDIIILASVVMFYILSILPNKLLFQFFPAICINGKKVIECLITGLCVCMGGGCFPFFYLSASIVSYYSQSFPDCCSSRFKNKYVSSKLKQATINSKPPMFLRFMSIYKQD